MHLASQAQWCLVDVVGQISVDTVFLDWFVDKELIFDSALDIFHLLLQSLYLFILSLATSEKLQGDRLGLLQVLLHFDKASSAVIKVAVHMLLQILRLVKLILQGLDT